MAKKISSSDLFEQEDLFKGVRDSATKTLAVFNELQAELKATAQGLKSELSANTQASTAQLKQFSAASEQANKLMKQAVEIEKLKAQADQQKIKAEQEIVKLQKMQAQELARVAKEQEKAAKLAQSESSAYAKLSKELNNARKAYKDLAVSNQENTTEGKELLATITQLDSQLKKVDATVGQHQRNVGNYEGATRNLKTELRALTRELMNMDSSDPRFQAMTQRAGELKDQISDTQAVVKATAGSAMENFSSATAKAGQIGVAAFQGMESSLVLLGVKNEAVLQSMQKLQALAGLGDALKTLGGLGDMLTEIGAGFTAAASKTYAWVVAKEASTAATVAGTVATEADTLAEVANNTASEVGLVTQEATTVATVANTTATEAQAAATIATSAATGGATAAMKLLRIALITSGIGAIVVLLGFAADAMGLFSDKTGDEERAQKQLEKETEALQKATERYTESLNRQMQSIERTTQLELALARQRGASQKELTQITRDGVLSRIQLLEIEQKAAEKAMLDASGSASVTEDQFDIIYKKNQGLIDQLKDARLQLAQVDADIATQQREDAAAQAQAYQQQLQQQQQAAAQIVDLRREIVDEQIKLIDDQNRREATQLIVEAQRRIEDTKNTIADKTQKAQLIEAIEKNLIKSLDALDRQWYEDSLKAQKEADAAKLKAKNDFLNQIEAITEANTRRTMSDQAVEEREVTDKYFELEQLAKGDAEALAQIEIAKMNELNDIRLKYQNIDFKNKEEQAEKEKELEKKKNEELWQTTQEFAQKTTDFFKQRSDERIAQIEKEIAAAEQQADYYRQLAANGNINAQESLAEQERIIAESNRRKEREQKRAQRIELANTIYQTYAGHAAKDPDTALMKTIKDATLLQAFISSLPMFYDGTEDTGKGGGIDGKGGFHAVLHPHERVIPKSLNDQIGSLTNEQLTRLAMEYNNGRLVGKDVAHSSMDLAIMVNELRDLKEVIKQKPETNIELGQITQSAMEIVQSSRKGNTTVYNRFKVRK
jgi:hypothetical protein